MAGLICVTQTAEIALVAATVKTVLQLTAPTNQRGLIQGWGVYFDGTSTTAEPVQVEVLRQTTAGTGAGSPPTAKIRKPAGAAETVQFAAAHNFSAEPTAGDILDAVEVHPQQGYEVIFPEGEEIDVGGAGRIAIRCTAPAGVNVRAKFVHEE